MKETLENTIEQLRNALNVCETYPAASKEYAIKALWLLLDELHVSGDEINKKRREIAMKMVEDDIAFREMNAKQKGDMI